MVLSLLCPVYAPFLGATGVVAAISLCSFGAAYGTAKAGVGISQVGIRRPELIMKSLIPAVMAGIVAIYGLIIACILIGRLEQSSYSLYTGSLQFAAGCCIGLCGLAAGFAIGIVSDAGVRGAAQQPRLFTGMLLILIFAEVLGLYGLIVAIMLDMKAGTSTC